jgi:hypothetical protein
MSEKTWTPEGKLELAIGQLEEQFKGGALERYGTAEHLAIVRYLVAQCCDKDGKLNRAELAKELSDNSDFVAYASNAKKKLIACKLLPASAGKSSEYKE